MKKIIDEKITIKKNSHSTLTQEQKNFFENVRDKFYFPKTKSGTCLYFAGHSLGLMPKSTVKSVQCELESWRDYGVEGHFEGPHPWKDYHERATKGLTKLTGALPHEVVAMNSLTVNLHLMLVSFYRPSKIRRKILIEKNAFPSDRYAVESQIRFHGYDPKDCIVEFDGDLEDGFVSSDFSLNKTLNVHGDEIALILVGNCNYLSGQKFDFKKIIDWGHARGAIVGFNLAHGIGNLVLKLHAWKADFAVWCSYKYLNSGPGGIAGCFVHEAHHQSEIPRFEGWWGNNKQNRFKMSSQFDPIGTAETWQLSNPPIFQLAAHCSALDIYSEFDIEFLRKRSDELVTHLEIQLTEVLGDQIHVVTPKLPDRGSMLSLKFKSDPKKWIQNLHEKGAFVDFREPNIIRVSCHPLYGSFEDNINLVKALHDVILKGS